MIILLFIIIIFESTVSLIYAYLMMFLENYWETELDKYILFLIYTVFPIRDLFIAILFAYLYYYRGIKDKITK